MNEFFKNLQSAFSTRNLSYPLFVLNLVNIVLGIFYITVQISSLVWYVYGILIFISLLGNFLLIFLTKKRVTKKSREGSRINYLCYFYLVLLNISMLLILFGNLLISVSYSNDLTTNFAYYSMVYLGFFSIFGIGTLLSYLNIRNLDNRNLWKQNSEKSYNNDNKKSFIQKIVKIILGFLALITLLFGSLLNYSLIFAPLDDYINWLAGMVFFSFYLFLFLIMLSATTILLIMINRRKNPYYFYPVAVIGILISSSFLLPLLSTPYTSIQAENDFSQAFGETWRSKIPTSTAQQYFQTTPFTITEYFLGNHPRECNIDIDIQYYSNVSEGITLAYDAYYPKVNGSLLPGNNSVLINIHGGAWVAGDKGMYNMLQVNKYFAAQGYVVFDIQYGLKEGGTSVIPTPPDVVGDFSIDDQLRHIGNFTKQLNTSEFAKYNLNLNSVFITGNSAGGHLSLATALLIDNGSYTDLFGSHLNIKGIIPLYPGNPSESLIGGRDVFRNPEDYLITPDSPPCLMFQGTKDFCLLETEHIKEQYDLVGNDDCCIIWFPFQGHANDLYYSGHFNQYKLYYMERFLYLCTHDKIQ